MGDRCNVTAHVWTEDRDSFVDILGEPEQETEDKNTPGIISLEYADANYALCDEIANASAAGLHFVAYNSEGDNYGRGIAANHGSEYVTIDTNRDGTPVVTVPIDNNELATALEAIKLTKRILSKED